MLKLLPISPPSLGEFVKLLGQEIVNEVDIQRLQPISKFAVLVEELLSVDSGYKHIFQSFYFEMPAMIYPELSNSGIDFVATTSCKAYAVEGIITCSFYNLRLLIKWLQSQSPLLKALGNELLKLVSHHEFFQKESTWQPNALQS